MSKNRVEAFGLMGSGEYLWLGNDEHPLNMENQDEAHRLAVAGYEPEPIIDIGVDEQARLVVWSAVMPQPGVPKFFGSIRFNGVAFDFVTYHLGELMEFLRRYVPVIHDIMAAKEQENTLFSRAAHDKMIEDADEDAGLRAGFLYPQDK